MLPDNEVWSKRLCPFFLQTTPYLGEVKTAYIMTKLTFSLSDGRLKISQLPLSGKINGSRISQMQSNRLESTVSMKQTKIYPIL